MYHNCLFKLYRGTVCTFQGTACVVYTPEEVLYGSAKTSFPEDGASETSEHVKASRGASISQLSGSQSGVAGGQSPSLPAPIQLQVLVHKNL